MSKTAVPSLSQSKAPDELHQSRALEALHELERHGYVLDSEQPVGFRGSLLRHRFAPDLLLGDDGRIEVPLGQPTKMVVPAGLPKRGIFWGRGLVFLTLLALVTFLGFALVVNLIFAA